MVFAFAKHVLYGSVTILDQFCKLQNPACMGFVWRHPVSQISPCMALVWPGRTDMPNHINPVLQIVAAVGAT